MIKIFENILYEIFFINIFAVSDIIVTFALSLSLANRQNEARAEPNLFELCLARRRKAKPEEEEDPLAQLPEVARGGQDTYI